MAVVFLVLGQRASVSAAYAVLSLLASLILISQIQCKPICSDGFYYDNVTDNCDHCSDICDKAREQRTVEKCLKVCPDFKTKKPKCPPLEYYDSVVGRCDSCASICPQNDEFDSDQLSLCKEVCPDLHTVEITEEHGNDSVVVLKSNGLTSIIIAVAVPLAIVLIIIVFLLARRYHTENKPTPEGSTTCNRRPVQIDSDSHEMETLTARGDPLVHPEHEDG